MKIKQYVKCPETNLLVRKYGFQWALQFEANDNDLIFILLLPKKVSFWPRKNPSSFQKL